MYLLTHSGHILQHLIVDDEGVDENKLVLMTTKILQLSSIKQKLAAPTKSETKILEF